VASTESNTHKLEKTSNWHFVRHDMIWKTIEICECCCSFWEISSSVSQKHNKTICRFEDIKSLHEMSDKDKRLPLVYRAYIYQPIFTPCIPNLGFQL
jgi:hypothetical protein